MLGTDVNPAFVEHSLLQKEKYTVDQCNLHFMEHDFVADDMGKMSAQSQLWTSKFDICTFGFEVSLDLLRAKAKAFKKDAHLIVPLSR